jgi:hypothetical protein
VTYIALGRRPSLITSSSSMAQVSLVMRWCVVVSKADIRRKSERLKLGVAVKAS